MKKLNSKLLFLFCFLTLLSCQTEDDFSQFQESKSNVEERKNSFKSSSTEEVCIAYGIPNGYRVIALVYRPYCPSQGAGYTPNTAIIEKETSIPEIDRAGAGCSDNYCLWILGNNFGPNAYVDIRTINGHNILSTYRGSDRVQDTYNGQDRITLRLRSVNERNIFKNQGLRIWVVNPDTGKYSKPKTVRRPADIIIIDPPCDPICP